MYPAIAPATHDRTKSISIHLDLDIFLAALQQKNDQSKQELPYPKTEENYQDT